MIGVQTWPVLSAFFYFDKSVYFALRNFQWDGHHHKLVVSDLAVACCIDLAHLHWQDGGLGHKSCLQRLNCSDMSADGWPNTSENKCKCQVKPSFHMIGSTTFQISQFLQLLSDTRTLHWLSHWLSRCDFGACRMSHFSWSPTGRIWWMIPNKLLDQQVSSSAADWTDQSWSGAKKRIRWCALMFPESNSLQHQAHPLD